MEEIENKDKTETQINKQIKKTAHRLDVELVLIRRRMNNKN